MNGNFLISSSVSSFHGEKCLDPKAIELNRSSSCRDALKKSETIASQNQSH